MSRGQEGHIGFGAMGRGAYVCRDAGCIADAVKRRAFARTLRIDVGSVDWDLLEQQLLRELEETYVKG